MLGEIGHGRPHGRVDGSIKEGILGDGKPKPRSNVLVEGHRISKPVTRLRPIGKMTFQETQNSVEASFFGGDTCNGVCWRCGRESR